MSMIPLKEWAELNGIEAFRVRSIARHGLLKTAEKIDDNWFIDSDEKYDPENTPTLGCFYNYRSIVDSLPYSLSYDYADLIEDLKEDINDGLFDIVNTVRIERGAPVQGNYEPIVDYYFMDDREGETFPIYFVYDVLDEMEYMNQLFD